MSTPQPVAVVESYRHAAQATYWHDVVQTADVFTHNLRVDGPAIELVLSSKSVPPAVLEELATYNLSIVDVNQRVDSTVVLIS